ncbi:MAG: hypothetical protein F6J90_14950 [Moorea sp. SIOASIH]|nr:hypothetical protein [Moorena sp. SIOASIH]
MMNLKFDRINILAIATISLGISTSLLQPEVAQAVVLGDSATVVNTFEDSVITGGVQTFFGISSPETITDDVEFSNFIGFYDIDISDTSLALTLVDNSGATDPIVPAGRFDRNYFKFDNSIITSASLDGSDELNAFANVQVLAPGFSLDPADVFGTGIAGPIEFENGGLLIEIGEGSDFTNIGVSAKVNFTSKSVSESIPEPPATVSVLVIAGLMVSGSFARKYR